MLGAVDGEQLDFGSTDCMASQVGRVKECRWDAVLFALCQGFFRYESMIPAVAVLHVSE